MNLTINSQTLSKELRLLNKIVASKPAIPILNHVLLKAGNRLQLYTTDLELGLSIGCAAQVAAPGNVAIPVSKLLALCEQFPDADVTIALDGTHVRVTCGAFKSRLQAISADDFPQLPEPEGVSCVLGSKEFRQMIDRTRYAIADTNTKYLLQGALLTLSGEVAAMVATDSKRLSLTTMSRPAGIDARVILPMKTMDILSSQTDIGDIELTISERHVFFQSGERLLISRLLEGEFPKYERIIPRDGDKKATVECAAFAAALKRVGLVSEQNQAATFDFAPGVLDITSSSAEIGDASERLLIGYEGEPIKVCCNWTYVLDFLDAAIGQTVTLILKDSNSPMLLTDGSDFLNVVVLMRM